MRIRSLCITGAAATLLVALVAGCSVSGSATIGPPANCGSDPSVQCPGGGQGWSCAAGTNPETEVGGLSCSIPQPNGPNDDFCCFDWTYGSSCTPDDTLPCQPYSYGYVCAAGDNPASLDPSLNCSTPTPDGPNDDFCCQ
jgi:hypothetical protein